MISDTGLKFGRVMHITMKQITASLGQFFCIPRNFEIFHDKFGPGLRKDVSNSLRISGIDLKFGGVMHGTMKRITIENCHARPIF